MPTPGLSPLARGILPGQSMGAQMRPRNDLRKPAPVDGALHAIAGRGVVSCESGDKPSKGGLPYLVVGIAAFYF